MEITQELKLGSKIKELENKLEKLNDKIFDEWREIKWIKYYDKEKGEYINGGYGGFEKENKNCQEAKKLSEDLKGLKKIVEDKELEQEKQEKQKFKESGGVVVFVDGARNQWGGRYGITDENGKEIEAGNNGQIIEQIEIEAYAILKSVNWAKEQGNIKVLKIMTDCQVLSYGTDFKSKTKAGTYYWLARKIAKESNIELEFEWVSSKESKADYLTRK